MGNWGKFDFSELKQFGKNLEAMQKAIPAFMEECVRELANRLLAKVVPRTPADKGDLRQGWVVGQVTLTAKGAEVEVYNREFYALYVEHGHRGVFVPALGKTLHLNTHWTEGRFMMTISVPELERELPAIIEKKMEQFIKKYLG